MQDDFKTPTGSVKPVPKLKPITSLTNAPKLDDSFRTPEQISANETEASATPLLAQVTENMDNPPTEAPRGSGHHWFNLPWPPSKQEIILASIVLVMAVFTITGFALLNKPKQSATKPVVAAKKVVTPPKPTTVAATLSGLQVAPEVNQRPVVGVMIENSQVARPQSGLAEAGVVFEAIAEGGITRFLALFQDQQPIDVGPIRSARPYYVQWAAGFQAAYVHAGGSAAGLAKIKELGMQDLNEIKGSPFRRVSSRAAPHNLYSNVADLSATAVQRGYKSDYSGFERKTASPLKTPSASSIDFNISSALYNSNFTYDAASNSYKRSQAGAAHVDAVGKQLSPNVVIGMVVPVAAGSKTSQGGSYSDYNPVGSGPAYIFQDGGVTVGTWAKSAESAQITFTDQAGAVVTLNPGQTWLTALSSSSKVSYR